MSKQDRQGARTPAGLDQKYNLGRVFSNQERENARLQQEMNLQHMSTRELIYHVLGILESIESDLQILKDDVDELKGVNRSR